LGIKLTTNNKRKRQTNKHKSVNPFEQISRTKLRLCLLWSSLLRHHEGVKVGEVNKTKAGNHRLKTEHWHHVLTLKLTWWSVLSYT